ncbi:nuclear transport factor 2 family protein [Actinoallomurus sp. NBC_01490]|uniref:nuclear transport factor 2 family protein n=1 Tax=Actinoallomurus sp. NBC_01490 TaxID=2903557 RepID=UPI002E371FF8|nr:nuclear transport factor 2 family protein [Actinoallomurus sp. NBC_01490]
MTATVSDNAKDVIEIMQVIIQERQARDRGWWEELPRFYHPEAQIQTSWFSGPVSEYIERSVSMAVTDPAYHRLGQAAIRVNGHRAVAEVPMTIEFRGQMAGVEADLTVYIRLLHRVERREGQWRLLASTAIFERDTMAPAVPGAPLRLEADALTGFRPSYRLLSLWLTEHGHRVGTDRYGLDRPGEVDALYQDTFAWAGLEPSRGRTP